MPDSVVVIAAHADDEILGCGGTLARLAREGRPVHILLLADGETSRGPTLAAGAGDKAARDSAAQRAATTIGARSVESLALPDNRLDSLDLLDVIKPIEDFLRRHRPETVFTHFDGDVNVDHRVAHEAVLAACRPQPGHHVKRLLFFEVTSSTEWRPPSTKPAFNPNWFVDISGTLSTKLAALDDYQAEMRDFPHPRSRQAVEALSRWRGATCGVHAAEAFILGRQLY